MIKLPGSRTYVLSMLSTKLPREIQLMKHLLRCWTLSLLWNVLDLSLFAKAKDYISSEHGESRSAMRTVDLSCVWEVATWPSENSSRCTTRLNQRRARIVLLFHDFLWECVPPQFLKNPLVPLVQLVLQEAWSPTAQQDESEHSFLPDS